MVYDVIIIGGGVAGLGGAVYCARFNMQTLVLAGRLGGLIQDTHLVENYPGVVRWSGYEMSQAFVKHVADYKEQITVKEELAVTIEKKNDIFVVKSEQGTYEGKAIIFATGTRRKKLNAPGEAEFTNKGLSYCATCDAPLYKGVDVAIVGGSDSAAKEALLLSEHAKKVYILARSTLHPEPINMLRVQALVKQGKIEVIEGVQVEKVSGKDMLSSVTLSKPYKGSKELAVVGVFVEVGHIVENALAVKLGVNVDEKGEIVTDKYSKTNVPGFFAAGDVTDRSFKQAITGVAEACVAADQAYSYIAELSMKKK
ncbi:MAG: FAD-dependent oxidoreductase [Nanoarchaeota archaeon]|nr:FAD-dependent oxidoreductase [Nanoarchaeota archaeon]